MPNTEQLEASLQVWQLELDSVERRAAKLRKFIDAAKDILRPEDDEPIPVHVPTSLVPARPVTPGQRPPVRTAVVAHMREAGNKGWFISDLANELWERKWLGGDKKPSRSTLRQVLEGLQEQGVVVAEKQGVGKWAPNIWRLSNKMLAKPADLS